ncbi:MAG: type II toxin-antitoxin system Phd/YefM family antitoxin [Anaerolineaceae bacterium]|nr:type II toxin-antitoxin system Phd/YefM family antitoxin [Anaerolineaceae bacterium]
MIITEFSNLRNEHTEISEMAHQNDEPIYIPKDREVDIVVMSIESFERREDLLRLKSKLAAIEQQRINGYKTYSTDESHVKIQKNIRRTDYKDLFRNELNI